MQIAVISDTQYFYSLAEAADASLTVAELCDHLSSLYPLDAPVVIRCDSGYSYRAVTPDVVSSVSYRPS